MTTRVKNSSESSSSDSPLAARVHALIAQWREIAEDARQGTKFPHISVAALAYEECATDLEAALAAALAPNSEENI